MEILQPRTERFIAWWWTSSNCHVCLCMSMFSYFFSFAFYGMSLFSFVELIISTSHKNGVLLQRFLFSPACLFVLSFFFQIVMLTLLLIQGAIVLSGITNLGILIAIICFCSKLHVV